MLRKLLSFITNPSLKAGRKIELFTCEGIAFAEARLKTMRCPHCDPMTSFEAMKVDDELKSFTMCRTCGYVLVHDSANKLIGSAGFVEPQHGIYLGNLAREEAKRNSVLAARERHAYRNHQEPVRVRGPMADQVLKEVEAMEAKEAHSAYMADKTASEQQARKAA